MAVDLSKLYLTVKQREERDRGNAWSSVARAALSEAKEILNTPKLHQVKTFSKLEQEWLAQRHRYLEAKAPAFEDAIRSGDWENSYRTINNFNTGYDPGQGWIYIFFTPDRINQVKIGATINKLRQRLVKFRCRHEPKATLYWALWVARPAKLENHLHKINAAARVAGNTYRESNEWYSMDNYEIIVSQIINAVTPDSEHWIKGNRSLLFCDDPEARIELRSQA